MTAPTRVRLNRSDPQWVARIPEWNLSLMRARDVGKPPCMCGHRQGEHLVIRAVFGLMDIWCTKCPCMIYSADYSKEANS